MAASTAWLPLLCCLALLQLAAVTEPGGPIAKSGCQSRCGTVDIPYPFGFGTSTSGGDCYRPGCGLTCDGSTGELSAGALQVIGISIPRGEVHATMSFREQYCYSNEGKPLKGSIQAYATKLLGNTFTFSARNVFTVIGCHTMVRFSDLEQDSVTGCNRESRIKNGTCKGIGCCQTSIPEGLTAFMAEFQSFNNYTNIWDLNNCGYGFLVEEGKFEFNTAMLRSEYNYDDHRVPFVLDWVVGNETCAAAQRNARDYACRAAHSVCVDYEFGGYRCNCLQGFVGNPYLQDGCTASSIYICPLLRLFYNGK